MQSMEIGDIFDNRYKLIQALGHGGFAGAYLAEDLTTTNKVVIKLPDITQLGDPAVYERFRRELAIGKLLDHPDLPMAVSYSEGNPPYLVLRYFEGETLSSVLGEGKTFTIDKSVEMVANLLDALDYCHKHGVFHRDIKPENLVLGPDGHLKIIDFGIAVMEGAPRVTWRGFSGLVGTPEYMSPEQIKGERGGAKSDIYAVGCLLYNLISGNPPYTGDNPMTTMYQHLTSNPKPLTNSKEKLHPGIWATIKRALRRRKDERYETAADMAKDLRNPGDADLSYIDRPDPQMVAIAQHKNTHKILVIGGIVLGVVLALVLVFINWHK